MGLSGLTSCRQLARKLKTQLLARSIIQTTASRAKPSEPICSIGAEANYKYSYTAVEVLKSTNVLKLNFANQ